MNKLIPLLSRKDLVGKITDVLNERTVPPAEEMIALGQALVQIGTLLRGQPPEAAKQALLEALALLK
jgi:hypothetical protein